VATPPGFRTVYSAEVIPEQSEGLIDVFLEWAEYCYEAGEIGRLLG
jgi:hypothetical protein